MRLCTRDNTRMIGRVAGRIGDLGISRTTERSSGWNLVDVTTSTLLSAQRSVRRASTAGEYACWTGFSGVSRTDTHSRSQGVNTLRILTTNAVTGG